MAFHGKFRKDQRALTCNKNKVPTSNHTIKKYTTNHAVLTNRSRKISAELIR
jgi:hypothetical protein